MITAYQCHVKLRPVQIELFSLMKHYSLVPCMMYVHIAQ